MEKTDYLTCSELAQRWEKLRVSTKTLKYWRRKKNIMGPDFFRFNGMVFYRLSDVVEYENKKFKPEARE